MGSRSARAVTVFRVIARCSRWVSASRSRACSSLDLGAEVLGQGPGGVFLDVQRVEQGLDVHAVTACGSRQVGVFAPVRRRTMTWVIAQ